MESDLFRRRSLSDEGAEPSSTSIDDVTDSRPAPVPIAETESAAFVAQPEQLDVSSIPAPDRPAISTQTTLLAAWLGGGLVVILIALAMNGRSRTVPPPAPASTVPVSTPAPVNVSPEPAPPPPVPPSILDVRIAGDVRGNFQDIQSQSEFGQAPSPVGIALRHQGYVSSDIVRIELYLNGQFAGSCRDAPLNSATNPIYWCQYNAVGAGAGEFRILINGGEAGRYPFSVTMPRAIEPASQEPQYPDSQQPIQPSRRSRRANNEDAQPAQNTEGRTVTCVLPSGQETTVSYEACRRMSGVVY